MNHQAVFLLMMATREPGSQPWALSQAATRRASSMVWAQVKSRTTPPPMGWVRKTLSARSFSQR